MTMATVNATRARASRSCGNCRSVKRRCDKQTPSCGQCLRTRETCQGYRDEWDLVFRDQTNHTIKRSRKKKGSASSSDSAHLPPLTRGIDPSLDDIGVNYFLQDFVVGGRAPTRGYLNYIPTVYCADSEHPTLMASMAAVGLVALATHRPELTGPARAKYSEAIGHVNDALASPTESIKDSTLMSVISLGVFEHVTNFESWVRHVKGAAALVIARGKAQFSSRLAILLFNQVRADMTAACIQTVQPFPEDLLALQAEATKYTSPEDAFWTLGILSTQCATLYGCIAGKNHGKPFTRSWHSFLEEAIELQESFEEVLGVLAVQKPYATIQATSGSTSEMFFRGRYHQYQSFRAIRLWNNGRMVEIIVCEIVCWLINKIFSTGESSDADELLRLRSKLQYAAQIIAKRGEDILASVPQVLGLIPEPQLEGQVAPDEPLEPSIAGGYMLIWHLYTVGKSPMVYGDDRKWVIERLKSISRTAGIAMAMQLAGDVMLMDRLSGSPSPPR